MKIVYAVVRTHDDVVIYDCGSPYHRVTRSEAEKAYPGSRVIVTYRGYESAVAARKAVVEEIRAGVRR